jgi:hybrid cluster-associated redox disulfide protein
VEEVVSQFPRAARAFLDRGMHCVGCDIARFETLSEACRIYGQPVDSLLRGVRGAQRPARRVARSGERAAVRAQPGAAAGGAGLKAGAG